MTFFVGISGATGTGKSTVCKKLIIENSGWAHIGLDNFFIDKANFKTVGPWLDMESPRCTNFNKAYESLAKLKSGLEATIPVYSKKEGRVIDSRVVKPEDVLLAESYHIFHDVRIRGLFDLKIYLYASDEVLRRRRLARDPSIDKSYLDQFLLQEYKKYSELYDGLADVRLSATGSEDMVARVVYESISRYRDLLEAHG